jgi:dihydroorotate dehydrogenase (fumarate)
MADILNNSKVQFATCINSVGNGLVIDPEKEQAVIKPKGGFGGIGGKAIKPVALANVRKFRELLKPEIAVIGCGGVMNGIDVFEHILAGADAVQIGTALQQEGTPVFDRLIKEFKEVLQGKGYTKLSDFKNKLKVM